MEAVVISIGGSVIAPDGLDVDYIRDLARLLERMRNLYKIYVVVGGGRVARKYIDAARYLGGDEGLLDRIGIEITRANAMVLASAVKSACTFIPRTVEEACVAGMNSPVVVMGGTVPGHTTDAVSVLLAEAVGARRVVNATSVDGVYDRDPHKHTDAVKYDELSYEDALRICLVGDGRAGPNVVLDPLAIRIAWRSGIRIYVLNGRDLENLEAAVRDVGFHGTVVG
jgi:uridylate kinase